jgi:hypothetical protein
MHPRSIHFAAPPRHVPFSLKVINFFNGMALAGWLVFGFGMIFFWVFGLNADYSFLTFHPGGTGQGRVVKIEETGASENDSRVNANHYEYSVAGKTFRGISYSTGAEVSEQEPVTVEYDEDDPSRSRIEGMRRKLFGPGAGLVALFPLIGVVLLIPATLTGLKRNRLLRDGVLTNGTLSSKVATNVTVNRRRVYALTFDFTSRDGRRCQATARTSTPEQLQDEQQEPLLYDPENPSFAYLLDEAPARPQVEMNGELRGRPTKMIAVMILPAIVLAIHAVILAFRMGVLRLP